MNIGDFRTRRKVTGKFFFALDATTIAPTTSFRDYGNVLMVKQEPKIDRAQQLTARKGYVQVTHEEPSKADLRWSLKVDEHHTDLVGLLHLATTPSANNQASDASVDWSIAGVKQGYSYYIGAMGVSGFAVTDRFQNIDYTIDTGSGMLYIIPGGGIANNETVSGIFSQPALTIKSYTALSKTFVRGYARILLFDQNTEVPREVVTFQCELQVSDWGDHDGQKFNEASLTLLAVNEPVINTLELS